MSVLVLVRHGESVCNSKNIFTGWLDSELTEEGINEAYDAGMLLKNNGFTFDVGYTSFLSRASDTLNYILNELELNIPVYKSWMLNERCYGILEGMNKDDARNIYGSVQVQRWRRGLTDFPPPMSINDKNHPCNCEKYRGIDPMLLPSSENLHSVMLRVVNYFESEIKNKIIDNKSVIVVAHQNSLRALISYLEKLNEEDTLRLELPNAIPIAYELDSNLNILNKQVIDKNFGVKRR